MRIAVILAAVILSIGNLIPGGAQARTVNLAHLYGVASANAVYSSYVPALAIDADWITHWNAPGPGTAGNPFWLQVDLQARYQAQQIKLVGSHNPSYPGYTNVYDLYTSDDGSNWTLIHSGTLVDSQDPALYVNTINLPSNHSFRYAKYEVVGGTHWAHLCEMEILKNADSTSATDSLLLK